MLIATDIAPLRTAADDYEATERVKATLRQLRENRRPFYLTGQDLEPIFRWKLRQQYGRQLSLRATNTDDAYRVVTRAAFEVCAEDQDYELAIRVGILISLRAVHVPVASALLTLAAPDRYCVIDCRGWRASGVHRQTSTCQCRVLS